MKLEDALNDYVQDKNFQRALMVTGAWGCGKTYAIRKWAESLNGDGDKPAVAIVSLAKIRCPADLEDEILANRFWSSGGDGRGLEQAAGKFISSISATVTESQGVGNPSGNLSGNVGAAVSLAGTAIRRGLIGKLLHGDCVLVFDDFERCQMDRAELLMTINEYVEQFEKRVIVIANEERVLETEEARKDSQSDKAPNCLSYEETKEKLIKQTLRFTSFADLSFSLEGLARDCDCERFRKAFIEYDGAKIMNNAFADCGEVNLRTAQFAMNILCKIYELQVTDPSEIKSMNNGKDYYSRLLFEVFAYAATKTAIRFKGEVEAVREIGEETSEVFRYVPAELGGDLDDPKGIWFEQSRTIFRFMEDYALDGTFEEKAVSIVLKDFIFEYCNEIASYPELEDDLNIVRRSWDTATNRELEEATRRLMAGIAEDDISPSKYIEVLEAVSMAESLGFENAKLSEAENGIINNMPKHKNGLDAIFEAPIEGRYDSRNPYFKLERIEQEWTKLKKAAEQCYRQSLVDSLQVAMEGDNWTEGFYSVLKSYRNIRADNETGDILVTLIGIDNFSEKIEKLDPGSFDQFCRVISSCYLRTSAGRCPDARAALDGLRKLHAMLTSMDFALESKGKEMRRKLLVNTLGEAIRVESEE